MEPITPESNAELVCRQRVQCESRFAHFTKDFIPISRFNRRQLQTITLEMHALLGQSQVRRPASAAHPHRTGTWRKEVDPSEVDSVPLLVLRHEDLTEEIFRTEWRKGEPLVVTGLLPRFKMPWNPDYFIETYGHEPCTLVECQTNVETPSTVQGFFKQFGKFQGRLGQLKLKVPSVDRLL